MLQWGHMMVLKVCELAGNFLLEKTNGQIQYIHTESNHNPNIIKHTLPSVENRLSNLSFTEILFKVSTKH